MSTPRASVPPTGAVCELGDGCDSCSLAGGGCGAGHGVHGGGAMRSERAVVAAAGWVALSLSLATMLVARVPWAVAPAALTAIGAVGLVAAGTTALRRPGAFGDRAMGLGLRVLPWVVAGLLATLATGLVAVLSGP